jgi:hypothetical protein
MIKKWIKVDDYNNFFELWLNATLGRPQASSSEIIARSGSSSLTNRNNRKTESRFNVFGLSDDDEDDEEKEKISAKMTTAPTRHRPIPSSSSSSSVVPIPAFKLNTGVQPVRHRTSSKKQIDYFMEEIKASCQLREERDAANKRLADLERQQQQNSEKESIITSAEKTRLKKRLAQIESQIGSGH